jgi:hypothetical protein
MLWNYTIIVRYYKGYRQVFGQISSYIGVFGLIWGSIGPEIMRSCLDIVRYSKGFRRYNAIKCEH